MPPSSHPRAATSSFIAFDGLVDIATRSDGVIRLLYRPGHFVVEVLPLAEVWPPTPPPVWLGGSSEESVPEPADRADVRLRHDALIAAVAGRADPAT